MTGDPVRFGVLGTGHIASRFTEDLRLTPFCDVVAVGSRTAEKAEEFRTAHDIARAHASYQSLVEDDQVEVIYVAVPHPSHHEAALLALRAGKSVLVEKPFAMNLAQASEVAEAARAGGLFAMEAMWTRFLPQFRHIRRLLDEGRLGDIRLVVAEFGVGFDRDPSSRLYDPSLGGGALLDLGIYPVSLSHFVLGQPASIVARGDFTSTGVDAQTSVLLQYGEGRQAVLTTTLEVSLPNRAVIAGSEAVIEIDDRWHQPSSFTLTDRDRPAVTYDYHEEGNGLRYQAEEVARCIRTGELESPILPLAETLQVMATMDEIRAQIGLRYPGLAE